MTPSLGFNKPESANFIFECMQYLMPEEGGKKYTYCYVFFLCLCRAFCRGRCHSTSQMRDCGEDSRQQCLDLSLFFL